jgi:hypothetical protein
MVEAMATAAATLTRAGKGRLLHLGMALFWRKKVSWPMTDVIEMIVVG